MILDFGLTSNEVFFFDRDRVELVDKIKLRDSIAINQSNNLEKFDIATTNNNGKEIFGNSLRARIASR